MYLIFVNLFNVLGLFVTKLGKDLFGQYFATVQNLTELSKFSGAAFYQCMFMLVDEVLDVNANQLQQLKSIITEPTQQTKVPHHGAVIRKSYLNMVITSNHSDSCLPIEPTERRFMYLHVNDEPFKTMTPDQKKEYMNRVAAAGKYTE